MSYSKLILIGNLGKDPELRYTQEGKAVATFTVAVNDRSKDKSGEFVDTTTWFSATLFGKQAENAAKYLTKGSKVYLEGRFKLDEWEDRDGNKRLTPTVIVTEMQFIDSKGESSSATPRSSYAGNAATAPRGYDPSQQSNTEPTDDIPF